MRIRVNNLDKMIIDYEEIFDTVLDDSRISSLFDDIRIVMYIQGVLQGDAFCVEKKKYYKNDFGSLDSEMISFNFALTEKTDDQKVVNYFGYNKYLKEKMRVNNLDELIKDFEEIFDTVLDDSRISSLFYDIKLVMYIQGVREGDAFCVEKKKYYKNGIGDFDSKTILFNFKLTVKTFDQEVVNYLGYNKF